MRARGTFSIGFLAALAVACGGANAPPQDGVALKQCRQERDQLEQRLATLNERVRELESPAPAEKLVAVSELGEPEESVAPQLVAPNRYRVPRAFWDRLAQDPRATARQIRVVPATRNGKPSGLRLFGIRAQGPFAQLGLENGDELQAINGVSVTDPENALKAYSKAMNSSEVRLELIRRGAPLTLSYELLDSARAPDPEVPTE